MRGGKFNPKTTMTYIIYVYRDVMIVGTREDLISIYIVFRFFSGADERNGFTAATRFLHVYIYV